MEENKNTKSQLDEAPKRHREMTEERKNKRKKILIRAAVGIGVAAAAAATVARVVSPWINNNINNIYYFEQLVVGGAMGQWEEIPMQEDDVV